MGPMIDYIVVAVAAAIIAGATRLVFLSRYANWFSQGFAGDAAFHLAVVRELKRRGGYAGVPQFLIKDEPDSYPILFHRFAVLFPLRLVERYPYLPNLVLWVTLSTGAALYTQYVAESLLRVEGPTVGLAFVAIYCGLASNLSSDMNGINYFSLSERLLSRFACGLYFAALAVAMTFGDAVSFVLAVLAGTVTALSSMFGRQAIAFTTPLVSLIAIDLHPLVVLAVSALGALVVDGRYFVRGIRHMVLFSHAYNRHTKHSRYYKDGLSRFTDWRLVFGRSAAIIQRVTELEGHEPTRILFRYPELFLLGMLSISHGATITSPPVAIVLATFLVYVATSTKALRQFGEANRYMEYNLWILTAMALAEHVAAIPIVAWLAYGAWLAFVTRRKWKYWRALNYPESDRLLALLAPLCLNDEHTVMTVPFTLGAAVCVRAPCRALMYQGSAVTLALYEKFMEEIPFLKRDWRKLAREFSVTHVIAEKAYLTVMQDLVGWEYDFSALPTLAENDLYVVYAAAHENDSAVVGKVA
jgi:hypothetical protein